MGISSIEYLEKWWKSHKNPYFVLYRGFSKKPGDVIIRNMNIDDHQEALNMLHEQIHANTGGMTTGGKFTVLAKLNANDNTGFTVNLNFPRVGTQMVGGLSAGIGSMSRQHLPATVNGPAMVNGRSVEEHNRLITEEAREKWNMERRLEDMEMMLEQQQNPTLPHKLISSAFENPDAAIGMVAVALDKITALLNGRQGAPIGMAGFDQQPNQSSTSNQGDTATKEEEEDGNGGYAWVGEHDALRIESALSRMESVFPNLPDLLDAIADFIEKNPEMAKTYFNAKK